MYIKNAPQGYDPCGVEYALACPHGRAKSHKVILYFKALCQVLGCDSKNHTPLLDLELFLYLLCFVSYILLVIGTEQLRGGVCEDADDHSKDQGIILLTENVKTKNIKKYCGTLKM